MAEISLCELAFRWTSLNLADDKSTLVQVMAWCRQAKSHYLSQWWPRSMSPYGITRSQWGKDLSLMVPYIVGAEVWRCYGVNSLWPSDTIWQQRSGLPLAHVMACCLTAPSHYLNQCWLIISEVQSNTPGANELSKITRCIAMRDLTCS